MRKKGFTALFWVLLILMPILAACQQGQELLTPTPLPSPTPTLLPSPTIDWFPRTPTPTRERIFPTPTPESTLQPPSGGTVLIADGFADPKTWARSQGSAGTVALDEGILSMAVTAEKGRLDSLSTHRLPSNFYLELEMRTSLCSRNDRYGLYFWRFSQMGTLTLWFNCQGQFSLEREINGARSVLMPWTDARRFMPQAPATNHLGLWARDGNLYIFLNGVFQTEFKARQGMAGLMGLVSEAAGKLPQTVLFTELKVVQD